MKKYCFLFSALMFLAANAVEITRDGKAVADIAIPEKAVTSVQFAAEELQKFIKLMSGAKLEIVKENAQRKFKNRIYIGCKAAPESKKVFHWRCKADENNLYLHGNDKEIYSTGVSMYEKIREWSVESCGSLLAVYQFADLELGIRFIRPGDDGIAFTEKKTISVKSFDREKHPRLEAAAMSIDRPIRHMGGWKDFVFAEKFVVECRLWMLRNGMVDTYWFPDAGHSFTGYWSKFGKSHPGYFARLVDGTRRPLTGDNNGRHIAMCLSNGDLQDRLVSDWARKKSRWNSGYWNYISACQNDSPEMCVCEKCSSWNGPLFDPSGAAYWGDKKIPHAGNRFTAMGIYAVEPDIKVSMTDRVCRFYLEIQKKAVKHNPAVKVYGYAYANYAMPPQKVKLNDGIMISYASTPLFPMDEQGMKQSKARWKGWADSGCLLEYRPNSTWAYSCMPLQYTKQLGGEYRMALNTSQLRRVFFDALRCEFSTQGLMYYTLARLTIHPEKTLEEIANEFFAVFGKAEPEVRSYYDYWQKISDAITCSDVKKWEDKCGIELNIFTCGEFCADVLKTEYFSESAKILEKAAKKADTPRLKYEIKFLQAGLEHARLAVRMQKARIAALNEPTPANKRKFQQYMRELTAFRHAHEKMGISDMGRLSHYERYGFTKSKPWKK